MLTLEIENKNGITIRGDKVYLYDRGFFGEQYSTFEGFYKAFVEYFSADASFYNEPPTYLLSPAGKADLEKAFDNEVTRKIQSV